MSTLLLKIHNGNDFITLKVNNGMNLLNILKDFDVATESPCGGKGKCGKCVVYCFPNSAFSKITTSEAKQLSNKKINLGARLACQTSVISDGEVYVKQQKQVDILEIDEVFSLKEYNPFVKTEYVSLPGRSKEPDIGTEIRKDLELGKADFSGIIDVPELLNKDIVVKLSGERIVSLSSAKNENSIGVAVDLGTTTIVVALVDLDNGKIIGTHSCLNPQRSFGADVISRISYIIGSENRQKELNKKVVDCINNMVEKVVNESGINEFVVDQYIISGNTTMIHILFSLPVKTIARAPYIPFTNSCLIGSASLLGLAGEQYTEVYSFPSISAFVGGDIVSGIMASGLYESTGCMFVDLGTNGELVYIKEDKIYCCSTAAGPAFEGANISCGTGNVDGAIYRVSINKDGFELHTINNEEPSGICGIGIISLIAELIKNKIIDKTGSFNINNISSDKIKSSFDLNNKRLYLTKEIFISQKDIRNFQLAKAAIKTGYDTLVKLAGNRKPDSIYTAGGFGSRLNPEDIFTVGLIPEMSKKKIKPLGNTSLKGAVKLLLDRSSLHSIQYIIDNSQSFDLSSMKEFRKEYVNNINF
ncbi:MAG: ASKHA domain-containing protein [Petrotogales bacterium]